MDVMMNNMKNEELKTQFLKVYANLPLGMRKEIICVLDEWGPMTWTVAYLEIKEKTKVSWKILKYLKRLELI